MNISPELAQQIRDAYNSGNIGGVNDLMRANAVSMQDVQNYGGFTRDQMAEYARQGVGPQVQRFSTPTPPAQGYNSFLDNLMSNLNPSGGMMGFDLPATTTGAFERPQLSNLNAVREQALADYKARKAAEEKAKNDALTKQLVDAGILTSVGDGMFSVNTGYSGYGPSDTSFSGWSDALAAAGQNSNVAVESMGTSAGYDGSAIGGGFSDGSDGGYW